MRRVIPILPTIVVLLAALLMVRLGFWQIHRLHEKEALLASYAANVTKPAFPLVALFPVTDDALYRRTSAHCLEVVGWTTEAGRGTDGRSGWRHIASCRTGAEGPGIKVDVGISSAPATPRWNGGTVRGRLTWAPSDLPLIARLASGPGATSPMIVSEAAAPGLVPTAQPNPADIANNHLSYAVQWFIFAALALIIYGVALWQRARTREGRRSDGAA
ncbi:SURF1 family protein [Sphingomonas crusticola]|uniref:SURF1 family protein n=1 Tax=Sphingomonas crusticola TaxID=1697973 RepID=UPI000E285059|nr:SURF1 family protein [Sphingomonas crusticola]